MKSRFLQWCWAILLLLVFSEARADGRVRGTVLSRRIQSARHLRDADILQNTSRIRSLKSCALLCGIAHGTATTCEDDTCLCHPSVSGPLFACFDCDPDDSTVQALRREYRNACLPRQPIRRDYVITAEVRAQIDGLRPAYFLFLILGGLFGLPVLLLTVLVVPAIRARRHPVFLNFCIVWIIYSVVLSLLFVNPNEETQTRFRDVCRVQAVLLNAAFVMAESATLALAAQVVFTVIEGVYERVKGRWENARTVVLVAIPYLGALAAALPTQNFIASNPSIITTKSFFYYCKVTDSGIMRAVTVTCLAITSLSVLLEVGALTYVIRSWNSIRLLAKLEAGATVELTMIVRLGLFVTFRVITVSTAIFTVLDSDLSLTGVEPGVVMSMQFLHAVAPFVAFLVFGTRQDVIRIWTLRKPYDDASSTKRLVFAVPKDAMAGKNENDSRSPSPEPLLKADIARQVRDSKPLPALPPPTPGPSGGQNRVSVEVSPAPPVPPVLQLTESERTQEASEPDGQTDSLGLSAPTPVTGRKDAASPFTGIADSIFDVSVNSHAGSAYPPFYQSEQSTPVPPYEPRRQSLSTLAVSTPHARTLKKPRPRTWAKEKSQWQPPPPPAFVGDIVARPRPEAALRSSQITEIGSIISFPESEMTGPPSTWRRSAGPPTSSRRASVHSRTSERSKALDLGSDEEREWDEPPLPHPLPEIVRSRTRERQA